MWIVDPSKRKPTLFPYVRSYNYDPGTRELRGKCENGWVEGGGIFTLLIDPGKFPSKKDVLLFVYRSHNAFLFSFFSLEMC